MPSVKLKLKLSELRERKPYLLFCGFAHIPKLGGWYDFKGGFSSISNAKLWLTKNMPDSNNRWAHIVYDYKILLIADNRDENDFITNEWHWKEPQ